jgi:uncharacterized protein (TIGR00369 family)
MTAEELNAALQSSGFIRQQGVQLAGCDAAAGSLTLRLPFHAGLERSDGSGQFHGGPIAALIDTAACFAVVMQIDGPAPTINLRTDYLRPAVSEALIARAVVRRTGRTVAVVDVDVEDAGGALVAIGRGSFATAGTAR